MLICRNCKFLNEPDTGLPPEQYVCGHCYQRTLYRQENINAQTAGGATIGAIIGGILGGPAGAFLGGIVGGILGNGNARKGK